MNKTKSFLVVAGVSLALAFTLSCSSDDGGGSTTGGGDSSSGNAVATIFCQTASACVAVSAEACLDLGGTKVNSCETVPPSSTSIGNEGSSSSADVQGGSSSSVDDGSSSSIGGQGSSSSVGTNGGDHFNPNINYGSLTDSRDSKTYRTVVIGTQTWMAENLNFNANDSKCYGEGAQAEVNDGIYKTLTEAEWKAYCATYGRLYSWATAMALNPSCNENECIDLIQTPHHGICPTGWHIPSQAEWDELATTVGGTGDGGNLGSGTFLKAASGWDAHDTYGNGTDNYGFSAIPSGFLNNEEGSFSNVGRYGAWWGSLEQGTYGYLRRAATSSDRLYWNGWTKTKYLLSVRCVKDSN